MLSLKDLSTTATNKLEKTSGSKPDFSYLDKIAASCLEVVRKAGNDATTAQS